MATKRVITRRINLTATNISYAEPEISKLDTAANLTPAIVPISCAVKNLTITLTTAPGVGTSRIFTLQKNGSDTNLSITISGTGTTGSDTNHKVTFSPGDTFRWKFDATGTPASCNVQFAYEIDGVTTGESCYFLQNRVSSFAGFETYVGVFRSNLQALATNAANGMCISPVAGTITRYDASFPQAISTGTVTFVLYKNGVAQDGTAGTPNTSVTANSGSGTSVSVTGFTLNVAEGDNVQLGAIGSSVVFGTGLSTQVIFSVKFTATTDGQSAFVSCDTDNLHLSTSAVNYKDPESTDDITWGSTEANVQTIGGVTTFTLSRFRVRLNSAPGAGKQYVFDWRLNGATPSNPPSVTISGTTTPADGSDLTNTLTVTSADTFNLRSTPTGTPTSTYGNFSAIQTALATAGNSGNTKSQGGRGHKGSVTSNKTVFGPNLFLTFDDIESYGVG